jgi:hypothetical protein
MADTRLPDIKKAVENIKRIQEAAKKALEQEQKKKEEFTQPKG